MRKIEFYDTQDELEAIIDFYTHCFNRKNISHTFGVLPFNNKYMLYIYAEEDIMKVGCFECVTEHINNFPQVVNSIEWMEDDPKYGTRFIIEYNPETNDYDLTYYKKED